MKSSINKLDFNKVSVVELNDNELDLLHGGSSKEVISLIVEITTYGTWLNVV